MARIAAAACALLFLFAAALQYNDPDPLRWMALYLAAAASCLVTVARRTHWRLAAATAAVALLWATSLAPRALGVPPADLFAAWEMADERIEVAREMYGLLIVAVTCGVFAVQQWRARRGGDTLAP